MNIAVIPARGGSKRVPGKNIRSFAGQPMIGYSIQCALRAGVFDRVIVSTDDDRIAEVSLQFGAEVPFRRPPELSDDQSGTMPVVAHAIEWLRNQGMAPSAVCCVYPTAPFLRHEDLQRGLEILHNGPWQFVFAATSYAFPVHRSFEMSDAGRLRMLFPEHFATRSQDLPTVGHDAGQFYWGRPEAWCDLAPIFGEGATVVTIPRWRVQDIDSEDDWIRAEAMASYVWGHDRGKGRE